MTVTVHVGCIANVTTLGLYMKSLFPHTKIITNNESHEKDQESREKKRPRAIADVRAGCCFPCVTAQLAVCHPVFP